MRGLRIVTTALRAYRVVFVKPYVLIECTLGLGSYVWI